MEYSLTGLYSLTGRVVMVTGAAGQIGADIIQGLLALGANCVATDSSLEQLKLASEKHGWAGDRVLLVSCDIRNREEIVAAMNKGKEQFGEIDALVNNAGVSTFEPFMERTEASIDWVMDVNIKGTIMCIKEFLHQRRTVGSGGAIVNIASHYGLISPDPRIYTDCARKNSEIYGATKAGIIQMTRYYSVHAADFKVRVNAVSPGGVRNPDNPQGADFQKNYGFRCPMERMADTHEIVGGVLFLLSPSASYINGHNLVVDGGMTCW